MIVNTNLLLVLHGSLSCLLLITAIFMLIIEKNNLSASHVTDELDCLLDLKRNTPDGDNLHAGYR